MNIHRTCPHSSHHLSHLHNTLLSLLPHFYLCYRLPPRHNHLSHHCHTHMRSFPLTHKWNYTHLHLRFIPLNSTTCLQTCLIHPPHFIQALLHSSLDPTLTHEYSDHPPICNTPQQLPFVPHQQHLHQQHTTFHHPSLCHCDSSHNTDHHSRCHIY